MAACSKGRPQVTDQDVRDANWAADAVAAMLERVRRLVLLEYLRLAQELGQ